MKDIGTRFIKGLDLFSTDDSQFLVNVQHHYMLHIFKKTLELRLFANNHVTVNQPCPEDHIQLLPASTVMRINDERVT